MSRSPLSPFFPGALFALLLALLSCQANVAATDADGTVDEDDSPPVEAAEGEADGDEPAASAVKEAAADDDDEEDEDEKEEQQEAWEEALEDLEEASGLFKLHHDETRILLELDEKALGREFLYFGALNTGAGHWNLYRGALLWKSGFVLRFEKRGEEHIVLLAENTRYLEPGDAREQRMLSEVTSEGVLESFDIEAELEDEGRYLIDLGSWFQGDNLELAKMAPGKGYSLDDDLSLFTSLAAYPRNVEIDHDVLLTGGSNGNYTQADPGSLAVKVRHSLCALPEDGFKPREYDQRVGYFTTERKDLFDVDTKDPVTRFINRWRLVKKDPTAEVSDPVEPIVYWIENSTPKRWRAAVRRGIEAWEPAFRAAGFSNAIVAKQMPEDADWEPGDVRYSVVQWSADENVGFAIGPSRVDPRTGEIFDADITMQEGFLRSYGSQYDTLIDGVRHADRKQALRRSMEAPEALAPEAADAVHRTCRLAGDERAQEAARVMALAGALQPDFDRQSFLESMLVETIAHEVGHTLGLQHNFKASAWRPVPELGDVEATSARGLVGSVMDYNPINLAAPDEDQGEFFSSVPGPYDHWAIEYGYRELPGRADTALAAIAERSPSNGLDFGTHDELYIGDALCQMWDMGQDPIAFNEQQITLAETGLATLREHGAEEGEGYHRYSVWYGMFSRHYQRAYSGLGRFLGGWTYNRDVVGQEDGRPPIVPIDGALQHRALDLLCDRGLAWTGGIPDADRLVLANRKYGTFERWFVPWSMEQVTESVNLARFGILVQLLNSRLYTRLGTQARLTGDPALTPHAVADRVFGAVWDGDPDEHDRWMQSDFVDLVIGARGEDRTPDVLAIFDSLLRRSETRLGELASSGDPAVATHAAALTDRITRWRERQKVEF